MDIEKLSAKFHNIYQQEARRQGDVRHKDNYEDLSENIKEFDRVLARYVEKLLKAKDKKIEELKKRMKKVSCELKYCKHNNKGICQKKEINLVQGYDDLVCQQFNYDGYDCKGD